MRNRFIAMTAALMGLACSGSPVRDAAVSSDTALAGQRTADSLAILALHDAARTAHLEKRADLLVSEWADDFVSVSQGGVSAGDRERGRASFQAYFDASTFQAWDDIVPPRITVSKDGEMAYVVVQKRVHLTSKGADGREQAERTRFAWLSVYRKIDGRWKLAAIASTDRPDST